MIKKTHNNTRRFFLKSLAAASLAVPFGSIRALGSSPRPLYIDGLSFLPSDINDVKKSKLDAYIADISAIETIEKADGTKNYKRTYKACLKSIQEAADLVSANPDVYMQGLNETAIKQARSQNRTAVFFQIQGADCVEADGDNNQWQQLDILHQHGLRVLQLTHHYGNRFAGGALDNDGVKGLNLPLTESGQELIYELNRKKMLIDVSHSSPQTALDAAKLSNSPIVQSHGAARTIVKHARCSPDEVIRAIADTGGVFGVFMMSFWLTKQSIPTIDDYIKQLAHVAKIGGIESVAIANDYPLRGQENLLALNNNNAEGVKEYLEWWRSLASKNVLGFDVEPEHVVIPELNNIHRMSLIDDALRKAQFKAPDRDKILGGNLHRVLNKVLAS